MHRKLVLELWTHFVCLASVASLLVVALVILAEIDAWLAAQIFGRAS
jgi:hypothetical protein